MVCDVRPTKITTAPDQQISTNDSVPELEYAIHYKIHVNGHNQRDSSYQMEESDLPFKQRARITKETTTTAK